MITPTRTVCYVRMLDGSLKEVSEARSLAHLWGWDFTNVKRVVVREEPVEQYHPGMVHDGDFSDLEIEPGKIVRYPSTCSCQKGYICRTCCLVLGSYAQATAWTLPSDEMFGRYKGPQS